MHQKLSRRAILKSAGVVTAGTLATPYFFTKAFAQEDPKVIRFYAYDGNLGDLYMRDWYQPFVEMHDLKAEYVRIQGGVAPLDKLQAQINAGRPETDILPLHANQFIHAQRNQMLTPVSRDDVPAYKDLHEQYITDFGPSMVLWCYGLAYNTEAIQPPPTSWKALWSPEVAGKAALNDALFEQALEMTNLTFRNSLYPVDEETFTHLDELRPNLVTLWTNGADAEQLFRSGEIAISPFWNGRVTTLKKEGLPLEFVVPDEGFFVRASTYAIPKNSRNLEMAIAWLDFVLGEKPQRALVEFGYGTPNKTLTYTPEEAKAVVVADESVIKKAVPEDFELIVDKSAEWKGMWTAWKTR